ncbi:MAG: PAS domain-containing protein [Candidatus Latescibacteria bacterium]|nr:PAS domain-containing protein [Candidatus Latescibacterota bacterium]
MLDNTGKIIFINDVIKQYGYSPIELIGKNVNNIFLGYKHSKSNENNQDIIKTIGKWLITKDKTVVPVEIKIQKIENAQIFSVSSEDYFVSTILMGTVCTARDLSEYRSPYLLSMSSTIKNKIQKKGDDTSSSQVVKSKTCWDDIKNNVQDVFKHKISCDVSTENDKIFLKEYYELVNE